MLCPGRIYQVRWPGVWEPPGALRGQPAVPAHRTARRLPGVMGERTADGAGGGTLLLQGAPCLPGADSAVDSVH